MLNASAELECGGLGPTACAIGLPHEGQEPPDAVTSAIAAGPRAIVFVVATDGHPATGDATHVSSRPLPDGRAHLGAGPMAHDPGTGEPWGRQPTAPAASFAATAAGDRAYCGFRFAPCAPTVLEALTTAGPVVLSPGAVAKRRRIAPRTGPAGAAGAHGYDSDGVPSGSGGSSAADASHGPVSSGAARGGGRSR